MQREAGRLSLEPEGAVIGPERQMRRDLAVFFFFQAEDGIRDLTVTGVQTCALPIFYDPVRARTLLRQGGVEDGFSLTLDHRTDGVWPEEAQLIQADLQAVGLKVDRKSVV